jgi:dTDP-4-amino-4,6-dideoxygalactose transaminase
MLRVHGARKKYHNETVGVNSRLDEIQAAVLRVKLPRIDEANRKRVEVAARYADLLKDVPHVQTPFVADYAEHVYHQYTIRITGGKRDLVQQGLQDAGIGSFVYYPFPLHQLPLYKGMNLTLPESELAAQEVLSLPIWPSLSAEDQGRIAETIAAVIRAS